MNFDVFLYRFLPRVWFWFKFRRYRYTRKGEAEIRAVGQLLPRGRAAIDVGASIGFYATEMARHANRVIAFEANPDVAAFTRKVVPRNVEVFAVALSSRRGRATLRIPLVGQGQAVTELATLAETNSLRSLPVRAVEVVVERLDDLAIEGCGLIKIDVEGHEEDVIEGGWSLIARDRPVLMVEISDAFNAGGFARVKVRLATLGYLAHRWDGGRLIAMEEPKLLSDGLPPMAIFLPPQHMLNSSPPAAGGDPVRS